MITLCLRSKNTGKQYANWLRSIWKVSLVQVLSLLNLQCCKWVVTSYSTKKSTPHKKNLDETWISCWQGKYVSNDKCKLQLCEWFKQNVWFEALGQCSHKRQHVSLLLTGRHLYSFTYSSHILSFICLYFFISAVCKVYSEQRAIRVKRVVDRKRMWVLGNVQ